MLPLGLALMVTSCLAPSLLAQEVAFWHFDEKAPGSTVDLTTNAIIDSSGNGHNGTVGVAIPYVAGSPGYGSSSAHTFNTTE